MVGNVDTVNGVSQPIYLDNPGDSTIRIHVEGPDNIINGGYFNGAYTPEKQPYLDAYSNENVINNITSSSGRRV